MAIKIDYYFNVMHEISLLHGQKISDTYDDRK